ncbi:MAG: GNAT family N-acetyltransferase [Elusimicrobiota bacterium]|jgi:RimJ/RimL family protein N-acetyltransferase|nr:GNAT family N-acetyltransferase [Elusimicrobiota bacterium]
MSKELFVVLKPFSQENISKTFDFIQNSDLRKMFSMRGEPDLSNHIRHWECVLNDAAQKVFAIYLGDNHLGNCGLKNIKNDESEFWIYIGDGNYRNKGFGKQAAEKLLNIAFSKYRLRKIYLYVLDFNAAAVNIYKLFGFKKIEMNDADKIIWHGRDDSIIKMELTVEIYKNLSRR